MRHLERSMRVARNVLFLALTMTVANMALQASALAADMQAETGEQAGGRIYRIGIHLWKPGKIYDEALEGIIDGLELEGIRYEKILLHSNRKEETAKENFRRMDQMDLDLIYSLSSAGTKIAAGLNLRTPVLVTVVNHPASLGLDQNNPQEGTRLTGTSYYVDAEKQLEFSLRLLPSTGTVGMIFDANNPAGVLAEEPFMRSACQRRGKKFISKGVTQRSDIAKATVSLLEEGADVIIIPTNRVVYDNLDAVLEITHTRNVPVLSMNKQGVENGALAALFADTYRLGRYTAPMARKMLMESKDPAEIPFGFSPDPRIIINLKEAMALDYEFPAEILGMAAIVLQ